MKTIVVERNELTRLAIYDFVVFVGVYFIPTISHLTSLPIYLVEPMRLMLFALIFLTPTNKANHLFVALTIPFVSFLFSGHPLFLKSLIMSVELVTNVIVLHYLMNKTKALGACCISIIVSKLVYYILKYALISIGLLKISLVSTNILWQVGVMLLLSIVGGLVNKKQI